MKKSIALVFWISFFAISTICAQEKPSEFGIKTGMNLAKISANVDTPPGLEEFTSATFLHGGIFWKKHFNDFLGMRTELLYNQKGGQLKQDFFVPDEDFKLRFDYLSLPLLFDIRWKNFGFQVGPQISYLLNVTAKSDQPADDELIELIWGEKDIEVAAVMGLSYQINKIHVSVRYDAGLTSLAEFAYTDVNGEPINNQVEQWNRALQISLGYSLF